MRGRWFPPVLLVVLFTLGCSKSDQEPTDQTPSPSPSDPQEQPENTEKPAASEIEDEPEQPEPQNTDEAQTPSTSDANDQPSQEPVSDEQVEAAIAEIEALQDAGKFHEAWEAARKAMVKYYSMHEWRNQLIDLEGKLRNQKGRVREVRQAISNLGSPDLAVVQVARRQVFAGGRVGKVLARRAVLEESEPVAIQSARLLAELRDGPAAAFFIKRLQKKPGPELRGELIRGLRYLADSPDVALLKDVVNLIQEDDDFELRPLATYLAGACREAAEGDQKRFDEMAGPGSFNVLKQYVQRALDHEDPEISAWGGDNADAVGLYVRGIKGEYYYGTDFEKLVLTRLDDRIDFDKEEFPHRQEDVSMRWTGMIMIPQDGEYTFYSASDDGQRLWVNGKQLIDDWNMHGVEEESGTITLEAGMYPFKEEYMQGGGGAAVTVRWKGPGIEKQVIPSEHYFTIPWPGFQDD